MNASIYLPFDAQNLYFTIIRSIFCVSITLHLIVIVFLVKLTPLSQISWSRYMLYIQAWLIVIDVHLEILLDPVPLFPAPAGYTAGVLCRMGVPIQIQGGIAILALANNAAALLLCVFHRHRSIIATTSKFRLGKATYRGIHGLLIIAYSIPACIFCAISFDRSRTDVWIKNVASKDSRHLEWITGRGCYFHFKRELFENLFIAATFMVIISSSFFFVFSFMHIKHVLNRHSRKRSDQSIRNTRKSVKTLFLQLLTPLIMTAIPAAVMFSAFAMDGLVSFEVCLSAFSIMYLHPIVHNILVLSLTPAFRKRIVKCLRHIANRSASTTQVEVRSLANGITKYSTS